MVAGFPHGNSKDDSPGQYTNVVSGAEGVDGIVHQLKQKIAEDLSDSVWRRNFLGGRSQLYANWKEEVDQNRDQGSRKGSQKIEQDDCFHIALLPFLLLQQGVCHQSED